MNVYCNECGWVGPDHGDDEPTCDECDSLDVYLHDGSGNGC
jgi:hypothetical protein